MPYTDARRGWRTSRIRSSLRLWGPSASSLERRVKDSVPRCVEPAACPLEDPRLPEVEGKPSIFVHFVPVYFPFQDERCRLNRTGDQGVSANFSFVRSFAARGFGGFPSDPAQRHRMLSPQAVQPSSQ